MTLHDMAALEEIVTYCDRIQQYLSRIDHSADAFAKDSMVQDACCMCVVQIGELVNILSDETKTSLSDVPWRLIKETRNFYVHNYGHVSKSLLWSTLMESIPSLRTACEKALSTENG